MAPYLSVVPTHVLQPGLPYRYQDIKNLVKHCEPIKLLFNPALFIFPSASNGTDKTAKPKLYWCKVIASISPSTMTTLLALGAYLNGMNRKIQLLVEALITLTSEVEPLPSQPVTLSEGSLKFSVAEDLKPGTFLTISLLLRPTYRPFLVMARVDSTEPLDEKHYQVQVIFTEIHEHDRQTIARHILRLQMLRRQAQR